jgi:putative ABC transport system permease protein
MNVAKGLGLEVGDDAVLVATNKDGSVNGLNLRVGAISENIMGPSGKDGFIHMDDARELLQIKGNEISEIAVRVSESDALDRVYRELEAELATMTNPKGKPMFEIHTWESLVGFSSIAQIVDLLIIVVRGVLGVIVLVSILNVMLMSVYERIPEVGTIASIGTSPAKIRLLFLAVWWESECWSAAGFSTRV